MMKVFKKFKKDPSDKKEKPKLVWLKVLFAFVLIFSSLGGYIVWKTGYTLDKISTKGGSGDWDIIRHSLPWVDNTILGEKEGRINILLLGMRGADDPAGGLLSDSEMIVSLDLKNNKIALVSIPRDLYVDNPAAGVKTKLNAIYAAGEYTEKGQGIIAAESKFSEISGVPIGYTIVVNQQAFKDVVDSLGGVDIDLENGFSESKQFMGVPKICNNSSYTIETGKYVTQRIKYKKDGVTRRVKVRKAQLCYPTVPPECGGNFSLDAGKNTLSGDQALCFVRSRDMSNDFERAKRQQLILQEMKNKFFKIGTLANFGKMNSLLDSLGNNVQTDLKPWEMRQLYDLFMEMNKHNPEFLQHTLEDSAEGLLYWPGNLDGVGYILLPRGDNYDDIHNLFQNIFSLPSQSDALAKI